MPSDSPVKFTEAKLHSADGKEEYDIRSGIAAVDYYEDLLKPDVQWDAVMQPQAAMPMQAPPQGEFNS